MTALDESLETVKGEQRLWRATHDILMRDMNMVKVSHENTNARNERSPTLPEIHDVVQEHKEHIIGHFEKIATKFSSTPKEGTGSLPVLDEIHSFNYSRACYEPSRISCSEPSRCTGPGRSTSRSGCSESSGDLMSNLLSQLVDPVHHHHPRSHPEQSGPSHAQFQKMLTIMHEQASSHLRNVQEEHKYFLRELSACLTAHVPEAGMGVPAEHCFEDSNPMPSDAALRLNQIAIKEEYEPESCGTPRRGGIQKPVGTIIEVFFKPGVVGMTLDNNTGVITKVVDASQAHKKGVRKGMKVISIDGETVASSQKIEDRANGDKEYKLTLREEYEPEPCGYSNVAAVSPPMHIQEPFPSVFAGLLPSDDPLTKDHIPGSDEVSPLAPSLVPDGNWDGKEEGDSDAKPAIIQVKESTDLSSVFGVYGFGHDVDKSPYHVEDLYKKKGCCQALARSLRFFHLTMLMVCFDAVYVGFEADHNKSDILYESDPVFMIFSTIFTSFFSFELMIRFLAFRRKCNCLRDGWFKFDLMLVSLMLMDVGVVTLIHWSLQNNGGHSVEIPVQPLRLLRLAKLTRMARMMRFFPELVITIKAMFRSLRAICSTLIMVALLAYSTAICLHTLLKEEDGFNAGLKSELGLDFSSLVDCIWTLLMGGTLMLDGSAPLKKSLLFSDKPNIILAGCFFMFYSFLSALCILQMLIGVLCDVVSRVGQEERDNRDLALVKAALVSQLQQIDGGNGLISHEELMAVMTNPQSIALLERLKINQLFLFELQKMMYPSPNSQVSIKRIVQLLLLCRGDCPATVETLASGICFVVNELRCKPGSASWSMNMLNE